MEAAFLDMLFVGEYQTVGILDCQSCDIGAVCLNRGLVD